MKKIILKAAIAATAAGALLGLTALPANAIGFGEIHGTVTQSVKVSKFTYKVHLIKDTSNTTFSPTSLLFYTKYTLKADNSTGNVLYTTTLTAKQYEAAVVLTNQWKKSGYKLSSQAKYLQFAKSLKKPTTQAEKDFINNVWAKNATL